ncbi:MULTISPECIES: aminoacyl-tRNA hydrolase [Pseudoalteromonas]|nr:MULTISPECIES: aminoacyl-tRNA hydrolase [Pseudoalteromonas]KZN33328.1 peptidyl-tRNA hydrolase [Pseudoalteromonas luteoviolacea S2607]KZN52665.1 peptidyl-tRNA hydrolase [Pseudoalteromonas luteoviolacea H33]KZN54042.1 peptidyl-tRNA hydrolase [Pseudoalteromonas luteoviolacea CPMOR-2]AOT09555.1 aminoacyl-tRNA hydrolase [Pseudoalteromonas luteoviolacea]AOT14467.1 aminoacyl-tRNA hydrolase [Pseudoalteromonas luteoviolacea]
MNNIQMLVGLANPGPEYANTRHNAGAWFIEELAKRYNCILKPDSKYHGLTGKVLINNQEFKLLIPTTYMNLSGKAVSSLANFFKIPAENILVAHDEMDMDPGIAKIKKGGGHGGHNGLKDIISKLGNNKEFMRLRIGIGHPGHRDKVTGWVLGKAPKADQEKIDAVVDEAVRCMEILAKDGVLKAQNRLHSFKP